jgi:phosphoglycolate phosphatase
MSRRHLIWDFNGTLLNDVELCRGIVNGMLARRGLAPMDRERYRSIMGFPVIDYYRKAGFDMDKEPYENLAVEYMEEYRARWRECALYPGVLEALADERFIHSLLSASWVADLLPQLAFFGLSDAFVLVTGTRDHLAHGKLAQGRCHIETLGVPPGRVTMVGDSLHDAQIARELGCQGLLLCHGHQSKTRLESSGWPVFDDIGRMMASLG